MFLLSVRLQSAIDWSGNCQLSKHSCPALFIKVGIKKEWRDCFCFRIRVLRRQNQNEAGHPMGETVPLFTASFNRAVQVESRPEHLTGEAGGLI